MEASFKNLIIGFILIALFGMLILTATTQTATNYDKDTSGVLEGSLSISKFNESITNIQQNAEDLQKAFNKQGIWSAVAGVVVEGIFGIAKDMVSMMLLPFNLVSNIMIDILGVPSWVTSVILGLLILVIIFGIFRLIKIGE